MFFFPHGYFVLSYVSSSRRQISGIETVTQRPSPGHSTVLKCAYLQSCSRLNVRSANEAREHLLSGAPGKVPPHVVGCPHLSHHQLLLGRSWTTDQRRPCDVHSERGRHVVSTADVCVKTETPFTRRLERV